MGANPRSYAPARDHLYAIALAARNEIARGSYESEAAAVCGDLVCTAAHGRQLCR
jgi:hypothetical protein